MFGTQTKTYLAVLLALSPLAAQANDKDTQSIERITVTGSRIAESLDEVPASITLIDQQTIKEIYRSAQNYKTFLPWPYQVWLQAPVAPVTSVRPCVVAMC